MPATDRFHGLLIIDKPAGWTSHDVVGRLRRLTGQRSIGHAGTLDPAATGVLPVALGSALRAVEYLSEASKSYRAEITFGISTDTLDIDGHLTSTCNVPAFSLAEIQHLFESFLGHSEQIPPVYSAIKIDGTPLYERARRGEQIEPPKRSIVIHQLDLVSWEPPVLTVDVDCSKGFYVRSFAKDLGQRVNSCAYLSNLVRTRVGTFDLCDAWTIEELNKAPLALEWERIALAPDTPALDLPAAILDPAQADDWQYGKRLLIDNTTGAGPVRVYDWMGNWLGIGELTSTAGTVVLHPRKVIPATTASTQEQH